MIEIVEGALETLRDLLIGQAVEEAKFLYGVSGQVEEIQGELKTIHCFLKDADARPDRFSSETVRSHVIKLKDLALRAEDVLENYAVEIASKRRGGDLKQKLRRYVCILLECLSVHQTGKEIQSIRSQMTKLTNDLKSMPSSSGDDAEDQQLMRETYANEIEVNFVGMEKDIENLLSWIKDDQSRSKRVISIWGMGGLGKTTLAREIYNHRDLNGRFESRVWVCISQQFQREKVLQQILVQIIPGEKRLIMEMESNRLMRKLYDVLKVKKCFIVIDDIWRTEDWDILKNAFPIAEADYKVLLTTRNEKITSDPEHDYKLGYLTEDQGWELLQRIALPNFHSQGVGLKPKATEIFQGVGRKIVQKCGRLPLAISVIGGSLKGKQTLTVWEKVSSKIDTHLKYREGAAYKNKRVSQVLDLSYTILPYYLKPCFLYLGCFEEDEEIDTEKLYLLWMAEGLISSVDQERNETLRDVAQRYLTELALRCMVQVRHESNFPSTYNEFISCRLHDLMRKLCQDKAEEEGFLKVMDVRHNKHNPVPSIRRLATHIDYVDKAEESQGLRSLLILGESTNDSSETSINLPNLKKMKFLRILLLEGYCITDQQSPSEVGNLILLRYLSFNDSELENLPVSICYLPYLHTLDLRTRSTITLPNLIHKLKKLRHLFLRDWCVSEGGVLILEGLKELETLVLGDDGSRICIRDLPELTSHRLLQAVFWGEDKNLPMIVDHMDQLGEADVVFVCCKFSSTLLRRMLMCQLFLKLKFDFGIGCALPSYEPRMCTNLVELDLAYTRIEGDDVMEVVGKFPMLKSFRLMGEVFANMKVMNFRAADFPQLRDLHLSQIDNLEKWEVKEGAMPNLSELYIIYCYDLEMIPEGLRFITTLQKLQICMPREFNDRLRVGGEDYYKVSHIPCVNLYDY